jgi:ACS family glucarate transporter-like MFS transporter/ACS family D-galactonate transporter-like MFS transporter
MQGEPPTAVRYQVLGLLTFAAAVAYLARNAVSVAESTIRDSFCLTLRESGWFMGAFFWSYAVLQIPSGSLAHRRGTRFALTLFAAAWSLAALLIGISPGLWLLMTAQLLMGAAQAGAFPASCLTISHWIPLPRRSFACGALAMGMQVGAIGAGLLTGPLLVLVDWRWVFVIYAVPGFLWAILFWTRFRDDPAETPAVNSSELNLIKQYQDEEKPESHERPPTPWRVILLHPVIWFLCGQQICRAAGYMFFASWFPTFLQATRGISIESSGYLQAFVFTGKIVGCLCGGLFIDWIWTRTGNLRISRSYAGAAFLTGCAGLILAAWFVEDTVLAVGLLALGALFASIAGPCAFSATIDIGGDYVTQVFGLMNMMGNLAAAATPILVAELFARTSDWTLVLLVFAGVYFLGAICWLFVDPRVTIRGSKNVTA